jgi:thiamine-monophosphate kinase
MARQSKCKLVVENIPSKTEVENFSKTFKRNFESLVFHSGEEYEIVITAPKKYKLKILSIAKTTKTPIMEIGKVVKGKGVVFKKDQKIINLKDLGYRHFK